MTKGRSDYASRMCMTREAILRDLQQRMACLRMMVAMNASLDDEPAVAIIHAQLERMEVARRRLAA